MSDSSNFRLVVDPLSDNQCDNCGETIKAGREYYAQEDDKEIRCVVCILMLDEEHEESHD